MRYWVFLSAIALLLLAAGFVGFFGWNSARFDVVSYWDAALRLRNAQPLYSAVPVNTQAKAFIYPPTFAALFAPFTLLPTIWGFAFWLALQLLLLPLLLFLGVQIANKGTHSSNALQIVTLILLVILPPLLSNTMEGQTNILVVTLVAGTLVFLKINRSIPAAFLLALATQLKVIPAIIIVALILARKYRECAWFAGFLGCLSLLPALWLIPRLGFAAALQANLSLHMDFFRYVLFPGLTHQTIAGAEQLFAPNYSIFATLSRYFGEGVALTPFSPQPAGPLLFAISRGAIQIATAIIGLLLFIFAARCRKDLILAAVLFYLAGTLLNPSCWEHHLIALSLLVAAYNGSFRQQIFVCIPIVLVFTVPSLIHIAALLSQIPDPGLTDISSRYSLPLIATLILWAAVARSHKSLGRVTA